MIPTGDRTAYSLRPGGNIPFKMRRQFFFQYNIGKLQPSSRFQHPEYFGKESWLVGRKIDYPVGNDQVKEGVGKGKPVVGGLHNLDAIAAGKANVGPGSLDHFWSEINTPDKSSRTGQPCGNK